MTTESPATEQLIQYRGYHSGPKDTGGMTALYPTFDEALARAKLCSFQDETAWAVPEFAGVLDTVLRAVRPVRYTEWKPTMTHKIIAAGESFRVGDVMIADHHVTRAVIAVWLLDGTVEAV